MKKNDALIARFAVEHLDRNSIVEHRRVATLRILSRVATQVAPRALDRMEPSDVMAWQASELARVTPNTLRNHESMLHAFVRWMTVAGVISAARGAGLRAVPAPRGAKAHLKPRPYKATEVRAMREALTELFPPLPESGKGSRAEQSWRFNRAGKASRAVLRRHLRRLQFEAQIALALEAGLRMSEIHGLTVARMHPDNECVVVNGAKALPGETREREVPYTDHARECVREWLDFRFVLAPEHDEPWLAGLGLEPLEILSMQRSLRILDPLTTPTKIRWHRLRHTFATERLRAGLPLEKLQVMMGHANLSQTLAYAEIVNADVVSEAERTNGKFAELLGLSAA